MLYTGGYFFGERLEILLYLLVFIFGYITHRTFHTYTATKTGSLIFLHGKMTVVLMLLKAIEKYSYVKSFGALQLKEKGASDSEIEAYKIFIDNDISLFKKQSIKSINKPIPDYLNVLEPFNNWDDAMLFIAKYKQELPEEITNDR